MKLRKLLAGIVAFSMALGIFTPISSFAEATGERNVMKEIFTDIDDGSQYPDEKSENLPYKDGTELLSVKEPMYGSVCVSESSGITRSGYSGIYGHGGTVYEKTDSAHGYVHEQRGSYPKLGKGLYTVNGKQYTFKLMSVLNTASGDFDGDGKEDELAYIIGARSSAGFNNDKSALLLCVGNKYMSGYLTVVSVLYESKEADGGNLFADQSKWITKTDLVCADLDGNGVDEVITFAPRNSDEPNQKFHESSFSYAWRVKEDAKGVDAWERADNWYGYGHLMQTSGVSGFGMYPGANATSGSLAVGDVNGDGLEDLVSVISSTNGSDSTPNTRSYFDANIIYGKRHLYNRGSQVRYDVFLSQVLKDQFPDIFMDWGYPISQQANFGVAVEDIDGSGKATIFIACKDSETAYVHYTRHYNPKYYVFGVDYLKDDKYTASLIKEGGVANHGFVAHEDNFNDFIYSDDPVSSASMQIQPLKYDYGIREGKKYVVSSGSFVVDGVIFAFAKRAEGGKYVYDVEYKQRVTPPIPSDNTYWKGMYTETPDKIPEGEENLTTFGYPINECIVNKTYEIYDIKAGSINGDSDAFIIYYRDRTGGGNKTVVAQYDCNAGAKQKGPYKKTYSKEYNLTKGYLDSVALTMANTDDDSIYLTYNDHYFFWSDPVIVAALASPPYFEALPGDAYGNGATTYGKTQTVGSGSSASYTATTGTYVSAEINGGAGGIEGVFENERESMKSMTKEAEQATEISYSRTFSTVAGEDTVVLSTIAFDAYHYTAHFPGADGNEKTTDYTAVVPRNGTSAMKIASMNYEDYLELVPYADTALPDLHDVFTHEVGKPDTYPKAPVSDDFGNVVPGSVMVHQEFASFPNNSSFQGLSMEINNSNTNVTETGSTVSCKMGGGVEVGASFLKDIISVGSKITGGNLDEKEYQRGAIVCDAEGVSFEGEVFGQGDGINADGTGEAKGDFNWRLMRYVYTNNKENDPNVDKQEFPVVTYVVPSVVNPGGVIPTSVTVSPNERTIDQVGPATPDFVSKAYFTLKAPGVRRESRTELVDAPVGMWLDNANVATSGDYPIVIKINGNVRPGTYTLRMKVGGVLSEPFKIKVNEYVAPVYLEPVKENVSFGDLRYKETADAGHFTETAVGFKNKHHEQVTNLESSLSDGRYFEITSMSATTLNPAGTENSTLEVKVRPKIGAPVGVHKDTVNVFNGVTTTSAQIECRITEPTVPGPVYLSSNMTGVFENPSPLTKPIPYPADDGGLRIEYYEYTVKDHPDYMENVDGVMKQKWVKSYNNFDITVDEKIEYLVGIRATNSCGTGKEGWSRWLANGANNPSEVRNLTAVGENGRLVISWDEPEYLGGNEFADVPYIVAYNVSVQDSNYNTKNFNVRGGANIHPDLVADGLTNGVEYTVSVQARVREYAYSITNVKGTPQNVVGTPSRVRDIDINTAYPTEARLTWSAPLSDGGSSVTGYQVSKDGGKTWENAQSPTGHNYTGLTINENYQFCVRAVNSIGGGKYVVKPVELPHVDLGEPGHMSAVAGNGQIEIHWVSASVGTPKGYELSVNNGPWQKIEHISFGSNVYVIPNLTNGTTYNMRLRTYDDVGHSDFVSCEGITPLASYPLPPQNIKVTPRNGRVEISWDGEKGAGETFYYTAALGDAYGTNVIHDNPPSHTFYDLENGKDYWVRIGVRTENDSYALSATYIKVRADASVPDAPSEPSLRVVKGDEITEYTWQEPHDGNSPILRYVVCIDGMAVGTVDVSDYTMVDNVKTYKFTAPSGKSNPREGNRYTVNAVNAVGSTESNGVYASGGEGFIGDDVVYLPVGYQATSSRRYYYGMTELYPGMTPEDGDYSDWCGYAFEGATSDKITWNGTTQQFDIAPGLPKGEYKATVRTDTKYDLDVGKTVKFVVCDAPKITTTQIPDGIINEAYEAKLYVVGEYDSVWTLAGGALPEGITLQENGTITGVPTVPGSYNYTVKATNVAGNDTKEYLMEIRLEVKPFEQITINDAEIADGNVNVFFTNIKDAKSATIIAVALDGNDKPLDVKTINLDGTNINSGSVSVALNTTGSAKLRIFAWESISSLNPVARVFEKEL